MYQTKTCRALMVGCIASVMGGLWLGMTFSALANPPQPSAKPPVRGKPGGVSPGGSRGDCLGSDRAEADLSDSKSLPAVEGNLNSLVPITNGETTAKYPVFLVYIPSTQAREGKFSLQNEAKQVVYEATLPLNGTAGVTSIHLSPSSFAGLEIGKRYRWIFSVACETGSTDQGAAPFVRGWITRTEINPALANQLAQASPAERIALYRDAGLPQDALTTAAELRRSSPYDLAVKTAWTDLLGAVGLSEIGSVPLF